MTARNVVVKGSKDRYEDIGLRDNFRQNKSVEDHKRRLFNLYKNMKPMMGTVLSEKFVMDKVSPLTKDDILLLEAEERGRKDANVEDIEDETK